MQQLLLPLFSPRPAMTVEEIARCPQNDILKVRCYELRKLKSVYSELLYKILFYRIQADPFVQKPCAAAKFARWRNPIIAVKRMMNCESSKSLSLTRLTTANRRSTSWSETLTKSYFDYFSARSDRNMQGGRVCFVCTCASVLILEEIGSPNE